jgi:hypothetical protein
VSFKNAGPTTITLGVHPKTAGTPDGLAGSGGTAKNGGISVDWNKVINAYLQIKNGNGKRIDLEFTAATVKVYAAGTIIRIDIKTKANG